MTRRTVLDAGIAALLVIMLATGLPRWFPLVTTVRPWVDPVAEATGLSQKNWKLFAPNVDKTNLWIEARITWSDGSETSWSTPDFAKRTWWQKIVGGRMPKIIGYQATDSWSALQRPLIRWVLRQVRPPSPGAVATEVRLVRHSWQVPRPQRLARAKARLGRLPPPREVYPRVEVYATWRSDGTYVRGADEDHDGQPDAPPPRRRRGAAPQGDDRPDPDAGSGDATEAGDDVDDGLDEGPEVAP